MGERTRVVITLILVLTALAAFGLSGCTREKPAPALSWVTPTVTPLTSQSLPTAGATVISAEETPVVEPAATSQVMPSQTVVVVTPSGPTPAVTVVVPTPVQPTPAPLQPTYIYYVRPGDTLYSIAQRHDTTVEELVRLNELVSADDITIGQALQVPGTEPTTVPTQAPATVVHIVQRGETLNSIARSYGVEMSAVMSANGITNPDRIYVGQQLTIPGATAPEEPEERFHVVQQGEGLLDIALRYGVSVAALQNANGITDPDQIYVGQRLIIP